MSFRGCQPTGARCPHSAAPDRDYLAATILAGMGTLDQLLA